MRIETIKLYEIFRVISLIFNIDSADKSELINRTVSGKFIPIIKYSAIMKIKTRITMEKPEQTGTVRRSRLGHF